VKCCCALVQLEKMDAATLSRTLVKVSRIASGRSSSDAQQAVNGPNTYTTQSSYTSQEEQDEIEMLFSKMSPVRFSHLCAFAVFGFLYQLVLPLAHHSNEASIVRMIGL
jgi:hypothetical protein